MNHYRIEDETLYLSGSLTQETINRLWRWGNRSEFIGFQHINTFDLSELEHIDSAGLALLMYWSVRYQIAFSGLHQRVKTLITLYDLLPVIESDSSQQESV